MRCKCCIAPDANCGRYIVTGAFIPQSLSSFQRKWTLGATPGMLICVKYCIAIKFLAKTKKKFLVGAGISRENFVITDASAVGRAKNTGFCL